MQQTDTWKQLTRQSGVGGIRKLLGQYRIDLALPGAPTAFEIKVYEKQDGRFEAVPSYVLSFAPPKPKTAIPARPAPKPLGAKPAEAKATERPAPLPSYPNEHEALSQTVQTLIQMARISKNASWEENPSF